MSTQSPPRLKGFLASLVSLSPLLWALVGWLLLAWGLIGCGPEPVPPSPTPLPTPLLTPSLPPPPAPSSIPSPTPSPTLSLNTSLPPSLTPSPAPSPTPPPTPSPDASLPPSLTPSPTPISGEPLSLSLGWRLDADGHLTSGIATGLGGRQAFLLTSLGRSLYALSGEGEVLWRARLAGPAYSLARLEGGIAVGDDAGFVTFFDDRGRRLWRYEAGSRVTALAVWQDGLLVSDWNGRLTLLGPDGRLVWQADLGGPVSSIAPLPSFGLSEPGLAVAATLDGRVCAFDPAGAEAWCFDGGSPVVAVEAVEGIGLLIGMQDGRLLTLDRGGGRRWQLALGEGAPVWHTADLAGDAGPEIVAGSGGGTPLLALLTADGQALWRVALPSPPGAITTADLGGDGNLEVLVGLMDGQVQLFDRQGKLQSAVQAGLSVWGLVPAGRDNVLVLADVSAWQLGTGQGPTGSAWLSPPPLLPTLPDRLPSGTERAGGEAILVFVGDVALSRTMEMQLARYGPAYPWSGLEPLLRQADLAVANLEGVLTTQGRPLNKPYLLRAQPRWGETLTVAGFDLVTLANNHALDYGSAGLGETLEVLEGLGIAVVGAGRAADEAHRPALFQVNGVRVAVLGYAAARWNGSADVPATDQIAWAESAAVQADVRAVRSQADLVVVLFHAGAEYAAQPSADQVTVAHAAVDAGADLVVGHHPHVVQKVERYKKGLIVYSLGDALFDIPRPVAMLGHLLRVHITPAGLVQAELWPFWIQEAIRLCLLDDGRGEPRYQVIYRRTP